jgi:hypothetical protein
VTGRERTLSGATAAIEGAGAADPPPARPRTVAAQARTAALPAAAQSKGAVHPLLAAIHISGVLPLHLAAPLHSDVATLRPLPVARDPPEARAATSSAPQRRVTPIRGMIQGMARISEDAVHRRIAARIPSARSMTSTCARGAARRRPAGSSSSSSSSSGPCSTPCTPTQCSALVISGAQYAEGAVRRALPHVSFTRAWFLRAAAGSSEGESAADAAYAAYRKSYAQQSLQAFFGRHCREEWLLNRCSKLILVPFRPAPLSPISHPPKGTSQAPSSPFSRRAGKLACSG